LAEVAASPERPAVIVHATSSAGTQTGMLAGCALFGLRTRVIGVSADEPAPALAGTIRELLGSVATRLGARASSLGADEAVEVDDSQVGDGYGVPTTASTEAAELVARTEGIVLDPVYTAKAMAGLISGEVSSHPIRRSCSGTQDRQDFLDDDHYLSRRCQNRHRLETSSRSRRPPHPGRLRSVPGPQGAA
jgi:1-aminocyclopropane-1-carboxylate deaminase/D-cysteine desulfhydrase-like pyridoxal-dependent ACC family enzyme